VSPNSDLNDLAQKLQQRKADEDYRRQRAIQQFAHRFRFAGVIMVSFFILLGFIFYMLNMRTGQPIFAYLMIASALSGWLYLLALPFFFVIRTTLLAYVLEKHWVWLSLALGLPVDVYLLPGSGQAGAIGLIGRIPFVFFAFLLWGFIRRTARRRVFWQEAQKREELWTRLLPLGVLDIALFRFWNIRPPQNPEPPTSPVA
jgi:hypothetical protein